jgi:hypothetical protein
MPMSPTSSMLPGTTSRRSMTTSATVGTQLRDLNLPIGLWEARLFDDFGLASGGKRTFGESSPRTTSYVHAGSHEIAGALSDTTKLTAKGDPAVVSEAGRRHQDRHAFDRLSKGHAGSLGRR